MKLKDTYNREFDEVIFNFQDNCFFNINPDFNPVEMIKKKINVNMLSRREILRLSEIFVKIFEIKKISFEGKNFLSDSLIELVKRLKSSCKDYKIEIGITSDAAPFKDKIYELKNSGIMSLCICLNTLKENKFIVLTGKSEFKEIMGSILLAERTGFFSLSIDCVVMKGVNDEELLEFVRFVKDKNINIRFIEYKPEMYNAKDMEKFMSVQEMKKIIAGEFKIIPFTGSQDEIAYNSYIIGETGTVSFVSQSPGQVNSSRNYFTASSSGILKTRTFTPLKPEMNLLELLRNSHLTNDDIVYFISLLISKKEYKYPELEKFFKRNVLDTGR
jgi:molybdenum cofactor biosynthesis enzyme MoaA